MGGLFGGGGGKVVAQAPIVQPKPAIRPAEVVLAETEEDVAVQEKKKKKVGVPTTQASLLSQAADEEETLGGA